jgi:hypothetical protein
VTNYHVFLCIVGLAAIVFAAVSIRNAFRTGNVQIGDETLGRAAHRRRQPVLFWMQVIAQIVGALVVAAAIVISIIRIL